jgi:hypothetical protein
MDLSPFPNKFRLPDDRNRSWMNAGRETPVLLFRSALNIEKKMLPVKVKG